MDAPSTAVVMSSTFVAPTVPRPAPRIRLSENSLFVTSSKPPPSETSPTPLSTPSMSSLSSMPSCTTVYHAPFTAKWLGTDPEMLVRIGKLNIAECGTFRIFLSLRLYVKSILDIVEVRKMPTLQF